MNPQPEPGFQNFLHLQPCGLTKVRACRLSVQIRTDVETLGIEPCRPSDDLKIADQVPDANQIMYRGLLDRELLLGKADHRPAAPSARRNGNGPDEQNHDRRSQHNLSLQNLLT